MPVVLLDMVRPTETVTDVPPALIVTMPEYIPADSPDALTARLRGVEAVALRVPVAGDTLSQVTFVAALKAVPVGPLN